MNKGLFKFVKIFYFTFGIIAGIFLAIILPNVLNYDYQYEFAKDAIYRKDFKDAIRFFVGYYDDGITLEEEKDGIGIFIFPTAIPEVETKSDESGEDAKVYSISKAYSGVFYGNINNSEFTLKDDSKPFVRFLKYEDIAYYYNDYDILDDDSDSDDVKDRIFTLEDYGYIFFTIRIQDLDKINEISLINNKGETVYKLNNLNLEFKEQFFTDVEPFVNEYNANPKSEALNTLDTEFRSKSEHYILSNYDDVKDKAIKVSCIIIVVYFLCMYALGDILVGKRYIIKGIKKFIGLFKKKKAVSESDEPIYGDYFTQVTFILTVPSDCVSSFLITYSNEQNTVEFALTKTDNYKVTKRVHAGVYVNAWVECEGYQAIDFPKTIEVRGFNKTFTATFTHKLDNSNSTEVEENKGRD